MIELVGVTEMVLSSCGRVVLVVVLVDVVVALGSVVEVDDAVVVVDSSVVLVVVEVTMIGGGSVVPTGRVLLVVEVSPLAEIASNVRGLSALAVILPVTVRQSGAIKAVNRTFRASPQDGHWPLIRVPRLVTFTPARRDAQAPTISTRRPVTAIVSTRAPGWSMSPSPCAT